MMMKFDAVSSELLSHPLPLQCVELKHVLHEQDPKMVKYFDEIQLPYTAHMQEKVKGQGFGELAQFLDRYFEQIESLLELIRPRRQEDLEEYLAAIENGVKYFAHDLLNYARLIPLHITQMSVLENDDPTAWEALKSGELVVSKSRIPSQVCSLTRP